MERMRSRIESLEDKIISVASENKKEAESEETLKHSETVETSADKKIVDTVAVPNTTPVVQNGIPVYYQIPVIDGAGHVVQKLPVERNIRKSSNGMTGIFAKLCFKKKSRADIVKLVATGDLVPAQLVQIKSAIEKGLTEMQLIELINNNISAEKMKEIIEIAVLENSMAD